MDFLFGIVFGLHHFGSAQDRLRLNNAHTKMIFLFGIVFGLHYLCGRFSERNHAV